MKLIFFGLPGVGKGTHGDIVSKKFGIPKISTGELLREEIKQETEIGKKAKVFMDAGKYVPDELTLKVLKNRLSKPGCKNGFILDGFPRTMNQSEQLDKIAKVDLVLSFNLSRESILNRLAGRWTCKNCQAIYHEKHQKPKKQGVCDKCEGVLYQRGDQKKEVIEKRLEVYEKETKPLIEFYRKKGILDDVYCEGDIKEVSKRVFSVIEKHKKLLFL